jgi:phosphotriesterase-related protein
MPVITVTGPVEPEALGFTDAHSHLAILPVAGGAPDAPVLTDEKGVGAELRDFKAAGGGAVIDCQPGGCGRDGRVLRRLSLATGIHVVAATGFHRRVYYPPDAVLWTMDADAAAAVFRSELREGLAETRGASGGEAKAGFIKIAAEATVDASPRALFEAAAAVCRETDCAIEMHTERGAAIEDYLRFFVGQGVDPRRLVFCHVDKRPDFGLHREMAEAGVVLEYDTFFRPKYDPERNVWPLLARMCAAGLAGSVALATDMADPGMWARLGGSPGLVAFLSQLRPRLAAMDLPDEAVRSLLGGTIARRLAVA